MNMQTLYIWCQRTSQYTYFYGEGNENHDLGTGFFLYIRESYQPSLSNMRTKRPQIILNFLQAAGRWKKNNELQNFLSSQANITSRVLTFISGRPVQVSWDLLTW
jgi:hypothetical protein